MAYEQYIDYRFKAKSKELLVWVHKIIQEYRDAGYRLTARQLHYQLVSVNASGSNWAYKNTKNWYQTLCKLVDSARQAGEIDWDDIEDRTRFLRYVTPYKSPSDFIEKLIGRYAEALWRDQDYYCEGWIEKDAMIGVLERPCNKYRVPYFATRGYTSSSELYTAGKRFQYYGDMGKKLVLFHLGDHDPSGVDMTRANREAVEQFSWDAGIEVRRLALNMDQIRAYNLVPNFAKETDSRTHMYKQVYGTDESWELDALKPTIINKLVEDAILSILDVDKFNYNLEKEREHRAILRDTSANWPFVAKAIEMRQEELLEPEGPLTPEDMVNDLAEQHGYEVDDDIDFEDFHDFNGD